MAGRSGARGAAAVEVVRAAAPDGVFVRSAVTEPTLAALLHRHRLEEDRRAAQGYFICAMVWHPLPRLERLGLRLRLGLGAELGGTIESGFLFRPEVALREPPASAAAPPEPVPAPSPTDAEASSPTGPRWRVLPRSAAH